MNAMNPASRADVLASIPDRFDESWTGYDPAVVQALRADGHRIGIRDDADSFYFARSLDYVSARNIDVIRAQTGIDRLVPTSNEIPVGVRSVVYRVYDAVGMAKIIGSNPDDLPRVEVRAAERAATVQTIGVSYAWTQQEMREARYSNSGLPTRKAALARDEVERKENSIKVRGDLTYGMYGVTNHPNIPVVVATVPAFTVGATAENIVDDVIALVNAIYTQSKGNFTPNVVAMPFQVRMAMLRKRMSGSAQTTAMAFLQQTFPNLEFVEVQELALSNAAGNAHNIIAAARNPAYYAYEQVMPFTAHPPQAQNLELRVPCEALTAGVLVHQPLAIARMEVT